MASLAVEVRLAFLTAEAGAARRAAAVVVALVAVGAVVVATVAHAAERNRVARSAQTIVVNATTLAERAGQAEAAAAVGVGLEAILSVILALRDHAGERSRITSEADAVLIR